MRYFRYLAVLVVATAASAAALGQENGPPTGADRAAIEATIAAQIAAFQIDDGDAAFSYAAPGIRARFGDADTFMDLVRSGYGPVYRPQFVRFLDLAHVAGRLMQRLLVVGPDGHPYVALYEMQRQSDGGWLINGVILAPLGGEQT